MVYITFTFSDKKDVETFSKFLETGEQEEDYAEPDEDDEDEDYSDPDDVEEDFDDDYPDEDSGEDYPDEDEDYPQDSEEDLNLETEDPVMRNRPDDEL